MKLTRDSLVLWLPVIGAVVTYLLNTAPPTQWDYHQWLQAVAAIVAALSTYLMTSPRPGASDVLRAGGKVLPALLLAGMLTGCASFGGTRHIATVSTVTAHTVLGALQDGERALVCEKPGAPAPPLCVPQVKHQEISQHFVMAFDLDGQVLRTVRALPPGTPLPGDIPTLLGQIGVLIDKILAAMPSSPQKTQLVQTTLGGK